MTLAKLLGQALAKRGWTLSTVESCTAGGLAYRITAVPGSSSYYLGGLIAYDNRVKTAWAGVPQELFQEHGAVSAEAAVALAESGRQRFATDVCLAVTGIAGPSGGSGEKPVGTVYLSACGRSGTRTKRFHFPGSRDQVRRQAIAAALQMGIDLVEEG